MKKLFTLSLAIILLLALTVSASAAQFVPSITNKGAPEFVIIENINGKDVLGYITSADGEKLSTETLDCFIVSSLTDALSGKELPEGVKDLLIKVYEEFKNGAKLSDICPELIENVKKEWGEDKNVDDLVIKDLFDITDICGDVPEKLKDGAVLDLTFKLGIGKNTYIAAMVYVDGKWTLVKDCINNGDGTVTVKFDKLCPVAFLVPGSGQNVDIVSPTTSDASGIILWGSVMLVSLLAVVALIVYRRRVNG